VAHCLTKNVLQTVSLPQLRNVLEMGGLPCEIGEDLPSRELASRKSYTILSRMFLRRRMLAPTLDKENTLVYSAEPTSQGIIRGVVIRRQ